MITKKELESLRSELSTSKKPMILFDDDTDGLSSFLLFYNFMKPHAEDIKGMPVKDSPTLKNKYYIMKIQEYSPDKIFVLDKPMIEQDFIDEVKKPMVWLDHHPLNDVHGIKYFNPLKHKSKKFADDNRPTTYWSYLAINKDPALLWIAMAGCVADWFIPEFTKEFAKKYPDLLAPKLKLENPGTILFNSRLGLLIKILQFNMNGNTADALKSMKIMTRIKDPYEILDQSSAQGRFIFQQYLKMNEAYEKIKLEVKPLDEKLLFFEYDENVALTGYLANEMQYANPEKFIIIARRTSDYVICSLRAQKHNVRALLEKSLVGIRGHGGGHEHACGCGIRIEDFEKFMENIRNNLGAIK